MPSPIRGSFRTRRQGGQVILETALVLPVFLLTIAAVLDLGLAMSAKFQVANAVRDGARLGAVVWSQADADTKVQNRVSSGLGALVSSTIGTPGVTYPEGKAAGKPIRVSLACTYNPFMPGMTRILQLNCGASAIHHLY